MSTPNRTICDVLEELRQCYKTRNFSYMPGLVEEAQSMANRMEAALWDQSDLKSRKELVKMVEKALESKDEEEIKEALKSFKRGW